ncbi:glycoside hydrolase family 5 protein [Sphingomonas sp. MMS24-JH45]
MAALIGPADTARFYRLWLDNFVTEADVRVLAGWGFNTIRVPMHHALFVEAGADGKPVFRPEGFALLDRLIGWSRTHRLHVILDMHAAPGGQGADLAIADRDPTTPSLWDSPADQATLVALWGELARRYRDKPVVGGYDVINEPNWDFSKSGNANGCKETDNRAVEALQRRIVAAIRVHDRDHLVVVEGNCWSNNYKGMKLDWDDNMVLSFHKY